MKIKLTPPMFIMLLLAVTLAACSKNNNVAPSTPEVVTGNVLIDAANKKVLVSSYVSSTQYAIAEYGTCWSSTNPTPTKADSVSAVTVNKAYFSSTFSTLTPGKQYYVRAYASNGTTIGYGDVVTFTIPLAAPDAYGEVSTFAGNTTAGFTDGNGGSALFNSPMGVSLDATGNIYVADSFNNAIRKLNANCDVITVAGDGTLGYLDGPAADAWFYAVAATATDAAGNIYVADRGNNMIRKISTDGVVSTLAGYGTAGYADGTGTAATFNSPTGLTIDGSGNLYVADSGNSLIRKVTPAGVVTTVAGARTAGYLDATGTSAYLNKPTGITIDASGNIYIAEALNHTIRKIDAAGAVTTVAGSPAAPAFLSSPVAVAIGKNGQIIIGDSNGSILALGTDKILKTVAGTSGMAGFADGDGSVALFKTPQGIATDAAGNIYVADYGNHRIRKIVVQ